MMQTGLSREFELLAACCQWPSSPGKLLQVAKLGSGSINWDKFVKLVRRQRVEGLVYEALAQSELDLPAEIRVALANDAAAIGLQNLVYTAESARLKRLLDEQGVGFLFVKGVTLAKLAYGSLAAKKAWDIDLLVEPANVLAASRLLEEAGYKLSVPGHELDQAQFRKWVTICKETLWIHEDSKIVVELHTSLVDNPAMMPTVSAASPPQMVDLGSGILLPTLQKDELFTYLCVHGAWHAWARIKWLADIAALLAREGEAEIERLYRRSIELGGGRSAAQALLLSRQLLGLDLPPRLEKELRRDRVTAMLVAIAVNAMAGRGAVELDDTIFGTVAMNVSHLLLGRGLKYKMSELGRKLRNPEDQMEIDLPPALSFLYPVIAVPRWIMRRARLNRS